MSNTLKLAQHMGNLQALHTLGLIPNQSLQDIGLLPEGDYGGGSTVGLSPGEYARPSYTPYQPQGKSNVGRTIRRVGPAAGATLGAIAGLLARKRLGGVAPGLAAGVGTGATAGWLPDIFATAGEELSS
ncbi:MAG: hypothetical protein ACYTEQ_30665 [Planctomycetota bacterium]|jgi:hypothetical protein